MATKKIQKQRTDRRTGGSIYDTVTKTLIELLEGGTIPLAYSLVQRASETT